EAKNAFIVAQDAKASDNLFDMFKTYYENVPTLYKPMKKKDNAKVFTFENPTSLESYRQKNPGLKSKIKVDMLQIALHLILQMLTSEIEKGDPNVQIPVEIMDVWFL
ncbi:MAG: large terminase protein, partial [Bacilli bacterium]|nr:large terminase protein [Bacilli bacterium]